MKSCFPNLIPATLTAAFAVVATTGLARSQDLHKTVYSGHTAVVISFPVYNKRSCYFGAPGTYNVVSPPMHGTVRAVIGETILHSKDRCDGTKMTAGQVLYVSAPGYVGPDTFTVTYDWNNGYGRGNMNEVVVHLDVLPASAQPSSPNKPLPRR